MHLSQGGHIKIHLHSDIPVQVDGEPWIQSPGDVVVLKSALKVGFSPKKMRQVFCTFYMTIFESLTDFLGMRVQLIKNLVSHSSLARFFYADFLARSILTYFPLSIYIWISFLYTNHQLCNLLTP